MGKNDTIRFSSEALEDIIRQLQQTQSAFQSQKSRLNSICSNIDRQSGGELQLSGSLSLRCGVSIGSGSVKSMLSDFGKAINACSGDIDGLSKSLNNVSNMFIDTENRILNRFNGISDANASMFTGTGTAGAGIAGAAGAGSAGAGAAGAGSAGGGGGAFGGSSASGGGTAGGGASGGGGGAFGGGSSSRGGGGGGGGGGSHGSSGARQFSAGLDDAVSGIVGAIKTGAAVVGGAVMGGAVPTKILGQAAKNVLQDYVDNWKTGAEIIKGKFNDIASAFSADWEAKGLSYRVVNGLGAVVNIVAGGATVVCALAGTGVTAGTAAPLTAIIGTYGANTFASGLADLYNCTFGDVNNVGQVNLLKSGLTAVGGQVGEWFGNRKAGESVGEITYIAGGLTSAVVSLKNLAGQIKQAGSAGDTLRQSFDAAKKMFSGAADEFSGAVDDLGYLLTKCDVRDLGSQFALFKKTIPNISSIVSDAKLIEKGVSGAKKLIDGGVNIVNTLAGWEMLKQPTFFDSGSQIGKILSVPGDAVNGVSGLDLGSISDGAKRIKDAFSVVFR